MPSLTTLLAAAALASNAASLPADKEADGTYFEKLATCHESWFDWKDDELRMSQYGDRLTANFTRTEEEPAFVPKSPYEAFGFPLIKVYPQSVGMGIGFSLQLGGQFAKIRSEVEARLGRPLECSSSDGMTSCGAELGENKTVTLTAYGDGTDAVNLLGCYYYYEK
jgi:hypothetical protein